MATEIAFTAVVVEGQGFMVGMTKVGLGGYIPVHELGIFRTYEDARAAADKRNERLGLTPVDAIKIVLGSF